MRDRLNCWFCVSQAAAKSHDLCLQGTHLGAVK